MAAPEQAVKETTAVKAADRLVVAAQAAAAQMQLGPMQSLMRQVMGAQEPRRPFLDRQ